MWRRMVVAALVAAVAAAIPCEEARMLCAYRLGCGQALRNYVYGCSGVLQGPQPTHCPDVCINSLIALTSTVEGKDLMNCECSDRYCEDQKRRTLVCGPEVNRTISEPIVSCRTAQSICTADAGCATALEYYHHNCRSMFIGRKCTKWCVNSISILRRQEHAAKLAACKCDGKEDYDGKERYDCATMQHNMKRLCHKRKPAHAQVEATTARRPKQPPPTARRADPPTVVAAGAARAAAGVLLAVVLGAFVT